MICLVDRAYRADLKDIRLFVIKTVLEKKTSLLRRSKIYVSLSILRKGKSPHGLKKLSASKSPAMLRWYEP